MLPNSIMFTHPASQSPASYFGSLGQAALRERTRRGLFCGPAPLGYRYKPHPDLGPMLVIDPETGPLVARLRQLHRDGLSVRQVVQKAHEMGLRGQQGKEVGIATVYRLLTLPVYEGLVKTGEAEWIQARHQAIGCALSRSPVQLAEEAGRDRVVG
jgi:hypothetical protein